MKVYLAARYSRRDELNGYADELRAAGHRVDARWLRGEPRTAEAGLDGEIIGDTFPMEGRACAAED